jgi:hypothetical protein
MKSLLDTDMLSEAPVSGSPLDRATAANNAWNRARKQADLSRARQQAGLEEAVSPPALKGSSRVRSLTRAARVRSLTVAVPSLLLPFSSRRNASD